MSGSSKLTRTRIGEAWGVTEKPQEKPDDAQPVDPTRKEFYGRLTKRACGLGIFPIAVAALLIQRGVYANKVFGMNDASRWVFVLGPVLLGVGILVVMVVATAQNLRKTVVIARSGLTFLERGEKKFTAPWGSLAYSPPKKGKKPIRTLLLSDGVSFGQLYDIFFPQFEEIISEVEARKGYASTSTRFKMG